MQFNPWTISEACKKKLCGDCKFVLGRERIGNSNQNKVTAICACSCHFKRPK